MFWKALWKTARREPVRGALLLAAAIVIEQLRIEPPVRKQ